jgi:hypothetical protein
MMKLIRRTSKVGDLRKNSSAFVAAAVLLMFLSRAVSGQLEVFDKNPNYLIYNGEPMFLIGSGDVNNFYYEHQRIDETYPDTVKSYGGNHFWMMLGFTTRTPWSFASDAPQTVYDNLRKVCLRAKELGIIVGLIPFGYNVYAYPGISCFDASCCGGPLHNFERKSDAKNHGFRYVPYGFLEMADPGVDDPEVAEARKGALNIMRRMVEATWDLPNVYYNPMWEPVTRYFWKQDPCKTGKWIKWFSDYVKNTGRELAAQSGGAFRNLIAVELTCTPELAGEMNVDFVVDEDGNAQKVDGIPYVYLSCDAYFRGTVPGTSKDSCWNEDCEPRAALDFMRSEMIRGIAGVASVWKVNPEEKVYMKVLSEFSATIDDWCDEPGREITDETVPPVTAMPGGSYHDISPGNLCPD